MPDTKEDWLSPIEMIAAKATNEERVRANAALLELARRQEVLLLVAVDAEREACAKLLDDLAAAEQHSYAASGLRHGAAKIRARGQQ